MYHIKIENCNNIVEGELDIEDGKLNILYIILKTIICIFWTLLNSILFPVI